MWRKLLILLHIILIIWILQTNWARQLISSTFETVNNWSTAVVNVPEKQKLMSLRDDFLRNNMALQPHQTDYIVEITDSAEEVRKFHRLYCVKNDKNPYLYGFNLERFCQMIAESGTLNVK